MERTKIKKLEAKIRYYQEETRKIKKTRFIAVR